MELLANNLGCQIGSFPTKYLGMLLGAKNKELEVLVKCWRDVTKGVESTYDWEIVRIANLLQLLSTFPDIPEVPDKTYLWDFIGYVVVIAPSVTYLPSTDQISTCHINLLLSYAGQTLTFSVYRLVCEDISGGLEDIPIPATNLVDDPPVAPLGKDIICAKGIKFPSAPTGCNCHGSCLDPRVCSCAKLNGSEFPYVHKDGGRLIEPKAVVFECGPNCGCGPACVNRTSQKGLRYRLEVFRTPNKGWGVRSWDYIPSGATICEYTGLLKKTDQIDPAADNNYVFDIDCLQTMKGLDGREASFSLRSGIMTIALFSHLALVLLFGFVFLFTSFSYVLLQRRLGEVSLPGYWHNDAEKTSDGGPEYCIDAVSVGNVARFINHSCQPNLFVQCVLSTHHDIGLARVVLMAADNIPPLQELTYDYGYVLDSVMDREGKVKQMACYCGAADCRKRLF
ncbi:hypothetical protein MTR67_011090 [Solanum verrucosum]|uniref:Histone-lysine N-methyltransferase, H3 lysine-9 specific SUVH4 n=1 Tax=Solanum verrucosum TaxID=315347 RepID=A0AAF0Q8V1_SOLVR|nr:hypothetical protein MTR67_011090 [Solanum verrucosum]